LRGCRSTGHPIHAAADPRRLSSYFRAHGSAAVLVARDRRSRDCPSARGAETCFVSASGIRDRSVSVAQCAEGAFDASGRSTAELGPPGASQESGGCKHQGSSHPAGGHAGIGHEQHWQSWFRMALIRGETIAPPVVLSVVLRWLAGGGQSSASTMVSRDENAPIARPPLLGRVGAVVAGIGARCGIRPCAIAAGRLASEA
jgi:hypothetical protein